MGENEYLRLVAIDPGPEQSAIVMVGGSVFPPMLEILTTLANEDALDLLKASYERICPAGVRSLLLIEQIESYGMPVGRSVFETVFWAGRFAQAWEEQGGRWQQMPRRRVKLALCHDSRAKDGNVRQALIDLYPPMGRGKIPQVGTKKRPGPLYGIKKDLWQALGLAVAWMIESGLEGPTKKEEKA